MLQYAFLSYRNGQPNAVYPDTQLVGRVTVVMVGQVLHKLCQVYFWLTLRLPKNTELLNKGNNVDQFRQNHNTELTYSI